MNLGLHKELYFFEWTRKEQLESSANLPVALLTVLAGGVVFLVRTFPYAGAPWTNVFVLFATGSGLSQIAGIYFLIRSLHGNWYEQIPSSDKLHAFFLELNEYHGAQEQAQKDFEEYLEGRLAEATAANRTNNTRTAGALHKATRSIIFALLFTGLSFVPYLAESLGREPETPTTQIEGPVELRSEVPNAP